MRKRIVLAALFAMPLLAQAKPIFPRDTERGWAQGILLVLGMIAVGLFLLAILLSWLVVLFYFLLSSLGLRKRNRPLSYQGPLIYFGLSLAVGCAAILFAMKLEVFKLDSGPWESRAWSVLVRSE